MGVKRNQAADRPRKKPTILPSTILFISIMIGVCPAGAGNGQAPSPFESYYGTVAIDAGHGGRDTGSRGTGGTVEKEVCLALAQQLTQLMEPAYRIVLTRSGDYDIALRERTAIANQNRADLLISIHTAASYLHSTKGMAIYYYQPPAKAASEPSMASQAAIAWEHIQMAHLAASRALASSLQSTLTMVSGQSAVKVIQAPLVVLQGADMPAVVIEVGYLTHPSTEDTLKSPEYLATLARAIAKAIDLYLAADVTPSR